MKLSERLKQLTYSTNPLFIETHTLLRYADEIAQLESTLQSTIAGQQTLVKRVTELEELLARSHKRYEELAQAAVKSVEEK